MGNNVAALDEHFKQQGRQRPRGTFEMVAYQAQANERA
jgi:hypothetical protein